MYLMYFNSFDNSHLFCYTVAGCIPLATGGVCLIPNISVLKKDLKENLQTGLLNTTT